MAKRKGELTGKILELYLIRRLEANREHVTDRIMLLLQGMNANKGVI